MKTDEICLYSGADGSARLEMFYSTAQVGRRQYMAHKHAEIEISAVISGSCEWRVRHLPRPTCAGDIILLGSGEEHYITQVDGDTPLKLMNLRFDPRFIWSPGGALLDARYLGIFLNHGNDFDNTLRASDETAKRVYTLMSEIFSECNDAKEEYELIVRAKLLLLLGILGRRYSYLLKAPEISHSIAQLHRIDAALVYIDSNLDSDLSLDDIARSAGMSRSYFCETFKKLNGISAWSYITKKRVALAARFLLESDMSITDIASRCGYNTMANFNRSFRMVYDVAPREYRAVNLKKPRGIMQYHL